jgi:iron complex outermembrane receptor protein
MRDGFSSDKNIGTERYMGTLTYNGNNILGGRICMCSWQQERN